MCGIMGYVGHREAAPLLLEGLSRLEYRGYDSAGIAVRGPGGLFAVHKAVGKLDALRAALENGLPPGVLGVGHTRWATHGRPSLANAHPQMDCGHRTVVVHNGIVENYLTLKEGLQSRGHQFLSQTDTEVLPHLVEEALARGVDLEAAVRQMLAQAKGALVVLVANEDYHDRIIAARSGNAGGLVVGFLDGEAFVASDLPALLPLTRAVVYLTSGEMAVLSPQGVRFATIAGQPVAKTPMRVSQDVIAAAKGGYKHFMLKEIMEQPEALTDAFRGRVDLESASLDLEELDGLDTRLEKVRRVLLTGCGTSYHAALVARHYIEGLTRLPVDVEIASELRYRDVALGPEVLAISVGQSGETADTLAAMEEAGRRGALQITVCNVMGSQATRVADAAVLMRAGPEMGVAATKTFTASLLSLYLLALHLAERRRAVSADVLASRLRELAMLPNLVSRLLERASALESLAGQYFRRRNFLYLGRGLLHPIALEGALKLKEISYIHAEGYPAGEMKHGPIALIDEEMPVVALAPRGTLREKMASNIEEVKAREGTVIGLITEGDAELAARVDHAVYLPDAPAPLLPVLAVVPLQLFAYYMGVRRGFDVDQPRNLAKSVTVE